MKTIDIYICHFTNISFFLQIIHELICCLIKQKVKMINELCIYVNGDLFVWKSTDIIKVNFSV